MEKNKKNEAIGTSMQMEENIWIELWAEYFRSNTQEAIILQTHFTDAELIMKNAALKWIAKQPHGRERLGKILNITNQKLLDKLCR